MRWKLFTITFAIAITISNANDSFANIVKAGLGQLLGKDKNIGDILSGKGNNGGLLGNPNAVKGDSSIEYLTEPLSGGRRKKGESCFTRNKADKNITNVSPKQVRDFLIDCDETILRYRIKPRSRKDCIVKERTNANVWAKEGQHRELFPKSGRDTRVVDDSDLDCEDTVASIAKLNVQKQICINFRKALENKCDACDFNAMAIKIHREKLTECCVQHMKTAKTSANEGLKYCLCFIRDQPGFPRGACKRKKKNTEKAGLLSALGSDDQVSTEEKRSMDYIGRCMKMEDGTSCLERNREGKKQLLGVSGDEVRKRLVECERNTLRMKVDRKDGMVYRISSTENVWHDIQSRYTGIYLSAEQRKKATVVDEDWIQPGKENINENRRQLNVLKQMCQLLKSMIKGECYLCRLKAMLNDDKRKKIRECAADRLGKPDHNAKDVVKTCTIREADC